MLHGMYVLQFEHCNARLRGGRAPVKLVLMRSRMLREKTADGGLAAAGVFLQNDAAVTLSSLLSVSLTWNKGRDTGP